MHVVDIVFTCILLLAGVKGLLDGFVKQIFSVLALGVTVMAFSYWRSDFTHWIANHFSQYPILVPLSPVLLLLLVYLLAQWVGGVLRKKLFCSSTGIIDHLLGAVIAVVVMGVVLGFASSFYCDIANQHSLPIPEPTMLFDYLVRLWRTIRPDQLF